MFDLGAWKPLIGALLLPPVPGLVLVLIGARLILPRRNLGFFILLLGVVGIWLSGCQGTALWLQNHVLRPPPAVLGAVQDRLSAAGRTYARQVELAKKQGQTSPVPTVGILVLGAGLVPMAAEYGVADLPHYFAERLRYGVWLSRQTGWPLGVSGGVGRRQNELQIGPSEAEVAGRVAQQVYGMPLRWTERESVDTRGNAAHSVALLADQGVTEIVVVTDAFHMPRSRRAFEQAAKAWAARAGKSAPVITPAPTKFWGHDANPVLTWMPSGGGLAGVRMACHELLGLLAGS